MVDDCVVVGHESHAKTKTLMGQIKKVHKGSWW